MGWGLGVAAVLLGCLWLIWYDFWHRFGARFDTASFIGNFPGQILISYDDGPASNVAGWSDSSADVLAMREKIVKLDPQWDFSVSTTANLLRTLSEFDVTALFFVRGDVLEADPAARSTLRSMHEAGHIIGNHSYSHSRLRELSASQSVAELARTHKLVADSAGIAPCLYRPPYGIWHIGRTLLAWREPLLAGYSLPVAWTHSTADWEKCADDLSPVVLDAQVATLLADMQSADTGYILLQHDVWVYAVLFTRRLLEIINRDSSLSIMDPGEFSRYACARTASARSGLLMGFYFRLRLALLLRRLPG